MILVWFRSFALQGILRRHFGWQTVPYSCRGKGKLSEFIHPPTE